MHVCPLCLEPLKPGMPFLRFCINHERRPTLTYAYEVAKLGSGDPCAPSAILPAGTFLLHMGCTSLNPFWSETREAVDVPPLPTATFAGNTIKPDHWEIHVLREAAKAFPDRREMWFPLPLIRSLNERVNGRRHGARVKLAGCAEVGKTTLASLVFNPHSFLPRSNGPDSGTPRFGGVDSFFHVNPSGEQPSRSFLIALHAVSLLREGRTSETLVEGTKSGQFCLRAAFLEPAVVENPVAARAEAAGASMSTVFQVLKGQLFDTDRPDRIQTVPRPVLAFYDTPGEDNEKSIDPVLMKLDPKMDVMAIFAEARDLRKFGGPVGNDSVMTAIERLEKSPSNLRRCLVVTKLDLIEPQLDSAARKHLDDLACLRPMERGATRSLLLSWLDGPGARSAELKLAAALRKRADMPVFFVWAEGLGTEEFPAARGMTGFASWCLGHKPANGNGQEP